MTTTALQGRIETPLSRALGVRYPIVCAPMFLISNADMLVAAGEAGILGAVPSLNYRTTEELAAALAEVRRRTQAPFAVNIIIKGPRVDEDLAACLAAKVPVLITSLGDPTRVCQAAHQAGARVFCDVINLRHAKKAEAAGADGVIAVGAGAGGHAGKIALHVLVPWLLGELEIPVIAAGGIATGAGVASMLALGAGMAYVGTRFIASVESPAPDEHKQMILRASPEDVEFTAEVTGTPANFLSESLAAYRNQKGGKAWKGVYSAGQNAGLIRDVKPIAAIVEDLVAGYVDARGGMPEPSLGRPS